MTATVTTVTFKRIKDYVLSLKEQTERKNVLVSPKELRNLLEQTSESLGDFGSLEVHRRRNDDSRWTS